MKLYISYLPEECQNDIEIYIRQYLIINDYDKNLIDEIVENVMAGTLTDIEEYIDISKYKYILSQTMDKIKYKTI